MVVEEWAGSKSYLLLPSSALLKAYLVVPEEGGE